MRLFAPAALAALALGCVAPRPVVQMDFTRTAFLATPFPGDNYLDRDDPLAGYPVGTRRCQVTEMLAMADQSIKDRHGFGLTGSVYFKLDGPLVDLSAQTRNATPARTVAADFSVLLADVTTPSAALVRVPTSTVLLADLGLIAVQPVQGFPLRPNALYVVALRKDVTQDPLEPSPTMLSLIQGQPPTGMTALARDDYRRALAALRAGGVDLSDFAAMTVFKTGDTPIGEMKRARESALRQYPPSGIPTSFALFRQDANYCAYEGMISMPLFQYGALPYNKGGGDWRFQGNDLTLPNADPKSWPQARMVLTLPKRPMPASGFPVVIFVRAGAGGDFDPMVDREPGSVCTAHPQGTLGPAHYFAAAGFAGLSVDGPFTGQSRAYKHGPMFNGEDGDIFNILNLWALRDNIRQSALEVVLEANLVDKLQVDASGCPGLQAGGQKATLDKNLIALFSHSMGSTIAPLALAVEDRFKAAVLSGAGASFIENVMYKQKPAPLLPIFQPFAASQGPLVAQDPVLNLFQWALEPADGAVYAPAIRGRHLLMVQGIVDNYILPPIAKSLSLSLGLDLAGDEQDSADFYQRHHMPPLEVYLPLSGGKKVSLPTSAQEQGATAIVFQALRDAAQTDCANAQDGHEVIFEKPIPKYLYRCFLQSLAQGAPAVPSPDGASPDPATGDCGPLPTAAASVP